MENKSFLQRFADVQAELKAPKSRTNKFGGYKYRSCEDILKAAKPLLKKYGMVLTMTDTMQEIGGRVYVVSTAVISDAEGLHTIQTSACAREAETKKGMDDSQITGTASSYARKYALNGLFCLADVTDAKVLSDSESLSYSYYQKNVKPAPKPAKKTGWVCKVCGYVYEGEELPADFICPLCKHPASDFEKI